LFTQRGPFRQGDSSGEDGQAYDSEAATHRPPWSAEPKHSSAFARIVQLGEVEWVDAAPRPR
jgi:hypothetical protein